MFFFSYCLHWLLDRTLWWVCLIPLLILSVSLAQKWWSANIESTSHISSFSQQGVSLMETLIWKYELICGWWFLCFVSSSVVSVLQAFSNQETYSSQVLHTFLIMWHHPHSSSSVSSLSRWGSQLDAVTPSFLLFVPLADQIALSAQHKAALILSSLSLLLRPVLSFDTFTLLCSPLPADRQQKGQAGRPREDVRGINACSLPTQWQGREVMSHIYLCVPHNAS